MLFVGWIFIGGLASSGGLATALAQEREAQKKEKQIEAGWKVREESSEALRGEKETMEDFSPTAQHRWTSLGKDFLQDQQQIWTSPAKLRLADSNWLLPVAGISAGLLVTDRDVSSRL